MQETDEIISIVMKLPEKYRIPIHLFYYEEYSAKEIGELLGMSEGTIFKRLQRAREQIKDYIIKKTGDIQKSTVILSEAKNL